MAGPGTRSILYRLIEAGQLARRALLVPLGERGLEAGDDAILLMLRRHPGAAEADLAVALGLDVAVLHDRLRRLFARDLLVLRHSGLALTERGTRMSAELAAHWEALEASLCAELSGKQRRKLRRTLGRFVARLDR